MRLSAYLTNPSLSSNMLRTSTALVIMIIVHVVFSTAAAVPPASNDVDGVGDAGVQEQVVFKGQVHAQGQGLEGSQGWFDPRLFGGRMLDYATKRFGEPLNVIISSRSDPYVLTDSGLHSYAKSIGFSEECMGLHYGTIHRADLGDGDGKKDEQFLARQYYFPVLGTCWESVAGGHHFRAWKQNGTLANSGAWFLGVSKEENSSKNHKITANGYNLGRDWLVQKAVAGSHWNGMWWRAEVEWNEEDLLKEGKEGVNHGIKQDGRVAILTVNRL